MTPDFVKVNDRWTRLLYFLGLTLILISATFRIHGGVGSGLFYAGAVMRIPATSLLVAGALYHIYNLLRHVQLVEAPTLSIPAAALQLIASACFLGGAVGLISTRATSKLPTEVLWFMGSALAAVQTALLLGVEIAHARRIEELSLEIPDLGPANPSQVSADLKSRSPVNVRVVNLLLESVSWWTSVALFAGAVCFSIGTGLFFTNESPYLAAETLFVIGAVLFLFGIAVDEYTIEGARSYRALSSHIFRHAPHRDAVSAHAATRAR